MLATAPASPRKRTDLEDLAAQVEARAAELAGFLAGADLPAELELDVMASLAAAEGLLAVAMRQLAEAGPIGEDLETCGVLGKGGCAR